MVTDFRVASSFQHHPKVRRLRTRLGDAAAFSLVCLWGHTAQEKSDGVLPNDAEYIAIASEWTGDAQLFVDTLIELRLLDRKGRSLRIHNWAARNSFAATFKLRSAQSREANRIRWERQRSGSPIHMRNVSEAESGSDAESVRSNQNGTPPLPLPFPPNNVRRKRSDDTEPEGFASFYQAYPRHEARKPALVAWKGLNLSPELQAQLLSDIERRKKTVWRDIEKKHIPLPATYLNGERWTDEISEPNGPDPGVPPMFDEIVGGGAKGRE